MYIIIGIIGSLSRSIIIFRVVLITITILTLLTIYKGSFGRSPSLAFG